MTFCILSVDVEIIYFKRLSKKPKVLFPGYLFIKGYIEPKLYHKMRNVPNLYNIMTPGWEPVIIPFSEVEVFGHLMENEIIGISDVDIENDDIVVVDGPLAALKGRIVRVDKRKERARVSIDILGSERFVDLRINLITKL